MTENSQPTQWKYILHIWWAFFWRLVVLNFFAGLIVGFFSGFVLTLLGKPPLQIPGIVFTIIVYSIYLPISLYALKVALTKTYRHFSVTVAPLVRDLPRAGAGSSR